MALLELYSSFFGGFFGAVPIASADFFFIFFFMPIPRLFQVHYRTAPKPYMADPILNNSRVFADA